MRKLAIAAVAALFAMSGAVSAGQLQGQQQGQIADSDATALNAGNNQGISQFNGNGPLVDNRSNSDVDNDYPVAQAWAAPLTSSNDTCMGSSSGGVQTSAIGVSLGTTWRDGDCVRRKDARLLHNMGLNGVAAALMCQKDNVAAAFEAAGVPCSNPNLPEPAPKAAPIVQEELGESDIQSSSYNSWDNQGHGFVH